VSSDVGGTQSQELPSFAVIIPVYNEEHGIATCVEDVTAVLAGIPNRTELMVVDDGSNDLTPERLAALKAEYASLSVIRHTTNQGYGAALRTGTFAAARRGFDYVVFMDSDLTNDPTYLSDFANCMADGSDVVKASRYVRGGGVQGVPRWRVGLSVLGNGVARLLFRLPIHDCTNGFRAVRTDLLTSVDLRENGFAVIMEELYQLRPLAGCYAEVPIVLTTRSSELRASSFSFGPSAMASYLKYPLLSALTQLTRRT
jgi:glycosyltransferase involved in cell wall biosynthesis